MSTAGFINKIYILASKINGKSKMLCGLKISPTTPTTDLSPVSWLNHSFFSVNKLSSMQGTAESFSGAKWKNMFQMETSTLTAVPILLVIKRSTALYELVVVYLNNHDQRCQGQCTLSVLSTIRAPLKLVLLWKAELKTNFLPAVH